MQTDLHTAEWIVARIESDVTIMADISGAYYGVIPPDVELPAVRFHVQTPHDVRGVGTPAQRIMTQLDWLVAVVTEGRGLAQLVPIADRLDTLLDNVNGETATLRVLSCVRLEPFSMYEEEDTPVGHRHAGGIYRTIVQPKA